MLIVARASCGACRWPRISRRCCRIATCCARRAARVMRTYARGCRCCRANRDRPASIAARCNARGAWRATCASVTRLPGAGSAAARLRPRRASTACCSPSPTPTASRASAPGADNRFVLANGRGAQFAQPQTLSQREFIVAVDADDRDRDARITLAAPLRARTWKNIFHLTCAARTKCSGMTANRRSSRGASPACSNLRLPSGPLQEVPGEAAGAAMLEGDHAARARCLPWNEDSRDLQARMEFVRTHAPGAR